ncbi:S8 family serine peptidase [Streptomyces sp. NPDC048200]|uniref:S8 family serine peptidase n=1 Tax=Streptomyces sp. NPDC048200 TaxID=3365512 RepID=UPI003717446F
MSGTSIAAAHVTGVAAFYMAEHPMSLAWVRVAADAAACVLAAARSRGYRYQYLTPRWWEQVPRKWAL